MANSPPKVVILPPAPSLDFSSSFYSRGTPMANSLPQVGILPFLPSLPPPPTAGLSQVDNHTVK